MSFQAFFEDTTRRLEAVRARPGWGDVLGDVFAHHALRRAGLWCEFGVYKGQSFARLAKERGDARLWGFDSFRGLPAAWNGLDAGHFAVDAVPLPPEGTEYFVGRFDTILPYLDPCWGVTLAHIDCDLCESATQALEWIATAVGTGTVIVFDEIWGYADQANGEVRALYEWQQRHGYRWDWIASGEQAGALVLK